MNRFNLFALTLVLSLSVIFLPGCSGGPAPGKNQLPTVSTKGTVQVDGKSVGPATLNLTSADKKIPLVVGMVSNDGKFVLTTYQKGDGAPKGSYTATLVASISDPTSKVPGVEPLKVEIDAAQSNLILDFKGTGKEMVNPLMVPPKNTPVPPK